MKRLLAIAAFALVSACTDGPNLGIGIGVGSGGVGVKTSVSGSAGNVTVGVSG